MNDSDYMAEPKKKKARKSATASMDWNHVHVAIWRSTHVPINPKRKSKTPLSEFFFLCSMMHKYSKNPWGQIPFLKFLSIYSREVFHKKSWVVVIFHFEEQSLVSSHPFCIRDREMRFSPLFCKLNVVINGSKFQQNRPIQSRDIA